MSELWKARLLPGSFRGIPFYLDSHELTGGRHNKTHEPPDRDGNATESIGKKTNGFRIDCHVLGDNYFFIRDALVNAMEDGDTGVLVHPYLGIKTVKPDSFSLREDTREGRIAYFSLVFLDAGNTFPPFAILDAITDFATTIVAIGATIESVFLLAYKAAELPGFAVEAVDALAADFGNSILEGFKNVRLDGTQHAETKRKVERFEANREEFVRGDGQDLNDEVTGIIEGLKLLSPDAPDNFTFDSSSGRDDKLEILRSLLYFDGGASAIDPITPTRELQQATLRAFEDLIQQNALVRFSELIVEKDFNSYEEAGALRQEVSDAVDFQLSKAWLDDQLFQDLKDLNAKIVKAVPNTQRTLNSIKTVRYRSSIPSIVLSYDLYESDANEQDIIKRNAVREPGFLSGDLDVLTGIIN